MLSLGATSVNCSFRRWTESKKYAAALYYLSRSHVSPINEAQWSRLNALQLQIAYGPYAEAAQLPEFSECSAKERKRREEDWKAVSGLQRNHAIRQFLDIVDNLFPNWPKTREITSDFEAEWTTQSTSLLSTTLPTHANSTDFPSTRRKPKPITRETHQSASSLRTALYKLQEYESKRTFSSACKLPKLNAALDSAETVSRLRRGTGREVRPLQLVQRTGQREAEELWENTARSRLTDLYEAVSSGRAEKTHDKAFIQSLVAGRSQAKETALDRISALLRCPAAFNSLLISPSSLESTLRPILQLQCQLLVEVETVLSEERNEPIGPLSKLRKQLELAISSLFQSLATAETNKKALERQVEQLEFELDTQSVALTAMAELYSVANWQAAAFGLTKDFRTEYQVEITRAVAVLTGPSCEALKALEGTLKTLRTDLTSSQKQRFEAVTEREKLVDAMRLMKAERAVDSSEDLKTDRKALEREIQGLRVQLQAAHQALGDQSPLLSSPTE